MKRVIPNSTTSRTDHWGRRRAQWPSRSDLSRAAQLADEAKQERERVREAVRRLPEQHRKIIELSHFQECSYREIADILDIPMGTVMSRLYNARRKLKTLLEED